MMKNIGMVFKIPYSLIRIKNEYHVDQGLNEEKTFPI